MEKPPHPRCNPHARGVLQRETKSPKYQKGPSTGTFTWKVLDLKTSLLGPR